MQLTARSTSILVVILHICANTANAQDANKQISFAAECYDAVSQQRWPVALEDCMEPAQSGDAVSQAALGFMYLRGNGVSVDYKESFRWFSFAALQGNRVAQFYLSVLYAEGNGAPLDYVLAYMWSAIAAENGSADGAKLRDMLEKVINDAELLAGQLLVRECIRSSYLNCGY